MMKNEKKIFEKTKEEEKMNSLFFQKKTNRYFFLVNTQKEIMNHSKKMRMLTKLQI